MCRFFDENMNLVHDIICVLKGLMRNDSVNEYDKSNKLYCRNPVFMDKKDTRQAHASKTDRGIYFQCG